MWATARVILRVTKVSPRRGDSWLNKMPEQAKMWPSQKPYRPTVFELHRNGRLFPPNYLHESWLDYLYWDTELEP